MIPCDKKLPTIVMIGGASKVLGFRIFNRGGSLVDITNCTARFAIIDSVNKYGDPIFYKDAEKYNDNVFSVDLNPSDTVNCCGKYIYQISIIDEDGSAEEPQQGYLYIKNNIDKDYLK